jgi:hypothetical protein
LGCFSRCLSSSGLAGSFVDGNKKFLPRQIHLFGSRVVRHRRGGCAQSINLFSSVELELKQPNPSIGAPFQSISCTAPQFLFGVGQDAEKPFGDNQLAKVVAFN